MKKKKMLIVPIFIPHEGCPYRCVFCSQVDITGTRCTTEEKHVLEKNFVLRARAFRNVPKYVHQGTIPPPFGEITTNFAVVILTKYFFKSSGNL